MCKRKLPQIATAVGLALMISTSGGLADEATADEPQEEISSDNNHEELICTNERPSGSRITRRVCRTQAQIDREREDAQDFIDRVNSREAQTYTVPDG